MTTDPTVRPSFALMATSLAESERKSKRPFRQRSHEANLGWFIVLGTISISIFGFVFKNQIESGARSLYLIGSALILFSFVMVLAERLGSHRRALGEMNGRDGAVRRHGTGPHAPPAGSGTEHSVDGQGGQLPPRWPDLCHLADVVATRRS